MLGQSSAQVEAELLAAVLNLWKAWALLKVADKVEGLAVEVVGGFAVSSQFSVGSHPFEEGLGDRWGAFFASVGLGRAPLFNSHDLQANLPLARFVIEVQHHDLLPGSQPQAPVNDGDDQ